MKKRMEARRTVQEFFKSKRKALNVGPFWDFSAENRFKRTFLARMNAIARDAEMEAMRLAEKGSDWNVALQKAQMRLEELKKDAFKELGEGAPWENRKLIELIRSL